MYEEEQVVLEDQVNEGLDGWGIEICWNLKDGNKDDDEEDNGEGAWRKNLSLSQFKYLG